MLRRVYGRPKLKSNTVYFCRDNFRPVPKLVHCMTTRMFLVLHLLNNAQKSIPRSFSFVYITSALTVTTGATVGGQQEPRALENTLEEYQVSSQRVCLAITATYCFQEP